jgi:hypothetical protein
VRAIVCATIDIFGENMSGRRPPTTNTLITRKFALHLSNCRGHATRSLVRTKQPPVAAATAAAATASKRANPGTMYVGITTPIPGSSSCKSVSLSVRPLPSFGLAADSPLESPAGGGGGGGGGGGQCIS